MSRDHMTEQHSRVAPPPWLPQNFLERVGAALVAPRRALGAADSAEAAGTTGSDVAVLVALAYVSTRLSELVAALWVLVTEDVLVGVRAVVASMSQTIAMDLALLFVAAVALTVAAGRKRHTGRDFDLACVAFVPLLAVKLVATLLLQIVQVAPTPAIRGIISILAYGWAVVVLVAAWYTARSRPEAAP